MTNKELLNIINEAKLDKQTEEVYKKYLYNYIIKNKEIEPKIFITDLISLSNTKKITDNDKKYICNFIFSIYQQIYFKLDYKKYNDNIWILKIK